LHDGDLITVDETMPAYGAYLETDYFSSDGSVLHLYPTPADPLKPVAAGGAKFSATRGAWRHALAGERALRYGFDHFDRLIPATFPLRPAAGGKCQRLSTGLARGPAKRGFFGRETCHRGRAGCHSA
jgi:hypothetical protein